MRITMNAKNMEITDNVRNHVEKKIGKLDKYLRDDAEVHVKLSRERAALNTAEITIFFGGNILRAEETSSDMYASLDKVLDIIVRQIRRHRTKLDKRLRAGAFEADIQTVEIDEEMAQDAALVRVKRFEVKPMSVEDAIFQMEMLGHSFYLFMNAETSGTSVVYKRQDGNYGLLEPMNA